MQAWDQDQEQETVSTYMYTVLGVIKVVDSISGNAETF